MKVAHVANMGLGGISRLVTDLANQQHEQGNQITIISALKGDNYFASGLAPDIEYVSGKIKTGYSLNLKAYINIVNKLAIFDVVHIHAFNALLIGLLRIKGVKMLYTEHGTFQHKNQINSLKNFIKKRVLGRILLRYAVNMLVFNSEWMMINSRLKNNSKQIIYNGIPLNSLTPPERLPGTNEVITVGRLVKKKRVGLLIDIVAQIPREKIRYNIIGDGNQYTVLERIISSKKTEHEIVLCGHQPNPEKYYKTAKLFLLGSENEPFGLVVLEAIRFGCLPLIFSDSGGAIEILKEAAPNLIIQSPSNMENAISYWLQNDDERCSMITELQAFIKTRFSVESMYKNYLQAYNLIK